MKSFIPQIAAALTVFNLCAAELAPAKPENFLFGNRITEKNGVLSVSKSSDFYSKQRLNINTAKRYRLSGEFRQSAGNGTAIVRYGVIPHTKQRQLVPASINIRPGTETELVADCKATDSVIKVKDASKWSSTPLDRVVFDIDPSGKLRDLPNFNISKTAVQSIVKKADHYEITLKGPCGMNFAAGSPVREHRIGWIAIFCCGANNKLTTEWKKLSHTFEPGTVAKDNIFRWWQGTELANIYMTISVPAGQQVEFRNLKLEELPEQP